MKKRYATLNALLVAIMGVSVSAQDAGGLVTPYNVVWESPSKDASGQMPLGNGDIAAGVYAIEDGALYLLLAKNDAFTYNGDISRRRGRMLRLTVNGRPTGKDEDIDTYAEKPGPLGPLELGVFKPVDGEFGLDCVVVRKEMDNTAPHGEK